MKHFKHIYLTLLVTIPLNVFGFNALNSNMPPCGVTADFTPTSTNVCTGEIVNFTNNSTGATQYEWHLNEVTFATSTNAVLSFGSSGNYNIELIADDGAGCLDSITIVISVDQAVNAGSDNNTTVCNLQDSIDLNGLTNGDMGGFWQETTSSGQFDSTSGILNYGGLTPGDFLFDYIVNGSGACPNDTASITVTVNQQPEINLILSNNNIDVSDSILIDFTSNGILNGAAFLWSFCDGNLTTDTNSFYYSWDSTGAYCVCVDVNNGNNCTTSACDNNINVFDESGLIAPQTSSINIYPNPAKDWIIIDNKNQSSIENMKIYNMQHELIKSQHDFVSNKNVIDLSGIPPGKYYFTIQYSNGIVQHPIIIK